MSLSLPGHARLESEVSELVIPDEIWDLYTFSQCPFFVNFLHLASRASQFIHSCLGLLQK